RISWKHQGVSGPTEVNAQNSNLGTFRAIADGRGKIAGVLGAPELTFRPRGWLAFETQRWQDPDGEGGLGPADETNRTLAAGAAAESSAVPPPPPRAPAAREGRAGSFSELDTRNRGVELASGTRLGGALSVADDIVLGDDEAWVLIPALRLDLLRVRGEGTPNP